MSKQNDRFAEMYPWGSERSEIQRILAMVESLLRLVTAQEGSTDVRVMKMCVDVRKRSEEIRGACQARFDACLAL